MSLPCSINNAGGPVKDTATAASGQSLSYTQPMPQHGPNRRALGATRRLTQPIQAHTDALLQGQGHGSVFRKHWFPSGHHSAFLLPSTEPVLPVAILGPGA